MRHLLLLLLATIITAGCNNDDSEPESPQITIEDELLGNWEYQSAQLFPETGDAATFTWERSTTCAKSLNKLGWLVRQIDVRILTDKKYLTLIMNECVENTDEYTHYVSTADYSLTVVDSTIQRPAGSNPTFPYKWRIRELDDVKLVMWRVAPEEATQLGVTGSRMLYTFKKKIAL
jgi:hypothetical protein